MRKIALTITVTTLVIGVFGAFFRWLQLMNAFDKETGFYISGAGITAVVVVYCVLAAIAFCLLMAMWLSRYDRAESAETALKCGTAVPLVISWSFCAAFVAASCILLFSAGASQTPLLQRLFGAFGILAGLSMPFLFGKNGGSGAGPMGRSASAVLTLFYCFWTVFEYKSISSDPIMWNYAFEVLAIAVSTVAVYFAATYYYGLGRLPRTLVALQLGVFLNVTVIFEPRSTALNVMTGVSAALQLTLVFLLIENLWEKRD